MTAQESFYLRPATIMDSSIVVQLIKELAEYEKLLHICITNEAALVESAFPKEGKTPLVYILIAHEKASDAVAGFALYFYNYSTFTGRPGLYLEVTCSDKLILGFVHKGTISS